MTEKIENKPNTKLDVMVEEFDPFNQMGWTRKHELSLLLLFHFVNVTVSFNLNKSLLKNKKEFIILDMSALRSSYKIKMWCLVLFV
jgi:hypothetical protein